jgi:hypothetical protein
MESPASIPKRRAEWFSDQEASASIPERRAARYSNDGSDFTVATDIDYISMACHSYGPSSDGQY